MKVYRRHACERTHRDTRTWARCAFPRAHWILGRGNYASISYCRGVTIWLHETAEQAEQAISDMHGACGGACHNRHHAVRIDLPTRRTAVAGRQQNRRAA